MNKKLHINVLKPSHEQLNNLLEFYQTEQYIDAEKLSLSITEEFPKHPFAWKVLGAVLKQTGRISESLYASQRSVQLEPKDADAHNNLGVIFQALRKLVDAEASYTQAIILKPDYALTHYNLGNTQQELGRLEKAEASYIQAITLKPDFTEAYNNLGIIQKKLGRLNEAETSYKKAIELKPDYLDAHNNLGVIFQEFGRLNEAEASYRKAIIIKPDHAESYSNLGNIMNELERLEEAEVSYRKAIMLKPDYAEAYSNLGNIMNELERLEEAEASYRKAITLKPDHAEAHYNLGITHKELGRLEEAEASYRKAITLKPDHAEAWNNIFFLLQAIKLQTSSIEDRIPLFNEQTNSIYVQILKSILNYHLNLGSPSTDKYFKDVLNILSSVDNTFIKNPKNSSNELIKPTLPEKITALVHFGRSGTGLMHSLIDGHYEVSTLPSIYFSEFFDHSIWEKIIAGGWEGMADRFALTYEVLFDASSTIKVASKDSQTNKNIGQKEGMTTVGLGRDEVLSVDKDIFIKKLKQLMNCYEQLDQLTFFKLVHFAYEITLENSMEKNNIFYHIHNPNTYAKFNFLRLTPNTNWLVMIREPLQSCESWVSKKFQENDYEIIAQKIFQMLFEVDHAIYQNQNSIGVRLEDLKEHPKKTIQALCGWLGIREEDSLYQMTAQGKKWWGDPTSPDYSKEAMSPFGKTSIKRKLGSVFSENDQYILRTLFYPFSVRFGYVEENSEKFENDLQTIRPMLDQMFDFEKKIIQNKKMNKEKFMKSGPYLFLRSGMIERWNTLKKFQTYPNMLTLLKIN
jgi:Flp pilus assembly protein TadD